MSSLLSSLGAQALLLLCAAQATQAPVAQTPEDFVFLGGLSLIINDHPITDRTALRALAERAKRSPISTQAEWSEARNQVLQQALMETLQAQAGEDMRLDPALVDLRIEEFLANQTKRRGLLGQAEYLQQQGLDSSGVRQDTRQRLWRQSWIYAQAGLGEGALGRPFRDRYVRPGELAFSYEFNRARLGSPDQYSLGVIELQLRAVGSAEATLALANSVHERLLGGEPLALLVEEFGGEALLPPKRIEQVLLAELRDWLSTAEAGEISPPIPVRKEGELIAYQVFELVERLEGEPPPAFSEPRMQADLRDSLVSQRENLWIDTAGRALTEGLHLWPESLMPKRGEP